MSNGSGGVSPATSTQRESSWAQMGAAFGAAGGGGLLSYRVMQQRQASGGAPTHQQRLIAMLASQKAQAKGGPNSVASGVVPNIRALHTVLGDFGSAYIGKVFKSTAMQQEMVKSLPKTGVVDVVRAMTATGGLEFGYWKNVKAGKGFVAPGVNVPVASPTWSNMVGGALGSAVKPTPRAMLQTVGYAMPKTVQTAAAVGLVTAVAGAGAAAGEMIDRFKSSTPTTNAKQ